MDCHKFETGQVLGQPRLHSKIKISQGKRGLQRRQKGLSMRGVGIGYDVDPGWRSKGPGEEFHLPGEQSRQARCESAVSSK